MRLAPSVARFMGVKYCKESELTLSSLLAYERSKGRISECLELVRITVTTLDGKTTTHTLDSEHHTVRDVTLCFCIGSIQWRAGLRILEMHIPSDTVHLAVKQNRCLPRLCCLGCASALPSQARGGRWD